MQDVQEKQNSDIKPEEFRSNDKPTLFNHPGFRIFVNCVNVVLLGKNYSSLSNAFFPTIFIFALPLFLDFASFTPKSKIRKAFRMAEIIFLAILGGISFLGFFGVVSIDTLNNGSYLVLQKSYAIAGGISFPTVSLWLIASIIFLISVVDNFTAKTIGEEKSYIHVRASNAG